MKRLFLFLLILFAIPLRAQVGGGIARVDSVEYEATYQGPTRAGIAQVNGSSYWVVFWNGADSDGYMASFTCTSAGVLGNAMTDTWEWGNGKTLLAVDAVPVAGTDYILFAWGDDGTPAAYVSTVSVSSVDGTITESLTTLKMNNGDYIEGSLIRVGESNYYAIAYRDDQHANDFGAIKSFSVNTGTGAIAVVDSLKWSHYDEAWYGNTIYQVGTSDYYIGSWTYETANARVTSFSISSANGAISNTNIDSLNYGIKTSYPGIVRLGESAYYLTVGGEQGSGDDAQLVTYTVSEADGTISNAVADTWVNTGKIEAPFNPFWLGSDKVFIMGGDVNARVCTVDDANGLITEAWNYEVAIQPDVQYQRAKFVASTDSVYCFIQASIQDADDDGWIRTCIVKGSPIGNWLHTINGVYDPSKVNGVAIFSKINGVD